MRDADDDRRPDIPDEALHALVARAVGEAAREEIDLPHVVVCRDPQTGTVTYAGPFRDGLAALVHADRESRAEQGDDGVPFEITVAALYPARADGQR
ncbi:hypothetical protein [Marmoricola sp. RAF53]|uniref:hypothetical protein n=1 Tax=Marmoricola sp. RAF53 TaxID=3233059 RepID=UPI003F9AE1B8